MVHRLSGRQPISHAIRLHIRALRMNKHMTTVSASAYREETSRNTHRTKSDTDTKIVLHTLSISVSGINASPRQSANVFQECKNL
jgi:hypothetical protein